MNKSLCGKELSLQNTIRGAMGTILTRVNTTVLRLLGDLLLRGWIGVSRILVGSSTMASIYLSGMDRGLKNHHYLCISQDFMLYQIYRKVV